MCKELSVPYIIDARWPTVTQSTLNIVAAFYVWVGMLQGLVDGRYILS
jgi:hypothetical protein